MRILVTGPRQWTDEKTLKEHLLAAFLAHSLHAGDGPVTLIHGGARGFDLLAATIAEELDWETGEYKVDWNEDRYLAGHLRNARMVASGADVCVAGIMACVKPGCGLPRPHLTHGTMDCIGRVLLAGIPLIPVHPA